jgi:putative membrane protein
MKHKNKFFSLLFMALVMVACGPREQGTDAATTEPSEAEDVNDDKFSSNEAENDAEFIVEAVASNYAEIEMAQLAAQRSDNPQVKEVAKMLETEHNKLLKDLQTLASQKSVTIPTAADDAARRKIEDLNKEEEIKDFNKEWANEMVDRHEKSIKKFEGCAEKTQDADVKNLINQALPHLRTHLDKVKAVQETVKVAAKSSR